MNATELFNQALPAALNQNPEAAKKVGAKFQFNIGGAGEWHLDLTQSGPACRQGSDKADVTINLSNDDFAHLLKNPQANAMQLFFSGKLKVTGNQMLAMKLKDVFSYVQR